MPPSVVVISHFLILSRNPIGTDKTGLIFILMVSDQCTYTCLRKKNLHFMHLLGTSRHLSDFLIFPEWGVASLYYTDLDLLPAGSLGPSPPHGLPGHHPLLRHAGLPGTSPFFPPLIHPLLARQHVTGGLLPPTSQIIGQSLGVPKHDHSVSCLALFFLFFLFFIYFFLL